MNTVYLIIGGNIGDRKGFLTRATEEIQSRIGDIETQSAIYETAAWGITDQQNFLNQVLRVCTKLSAEKVMEQIQKIESVLGRERTIKFGPRTIDIDILFYNQDIIRTERLTVPHAEMQRRLFVLEPLCEIAPDFEHPILKKSVKDLLDDCEDKLEVRRLSEV